jgi:hypothetical protein
MRRQPTVEELTNDPSLKWSSYQRLEVVWSDTHNRTLRFVEYHGDKVTLAEINSGAVIEGKYSALSIRRPYVR